MLHSLAFQLPVEDRPEDNAGRWSERPPPRYRCGDGAMLAPGPFLPLVSMSCSHREPTPSSLRSWLDSTSSVKGFQKSLSIEELNLLQKYASRTQTPIFLYIHLSFRICLLGVWGGRLIWLVLSFGNWAGLV